MSLDAKAELELRRRDFYRFVRETFPEFVDGWVYADLCSRLRQFMLDVRAGKSPRLIVCLPPRMGKSQLSTIRFALWCLLNNPRWEIIVASYSAKLVNRFSRAARSLVESSPYVKALWPKAKLSDDHASIEEWRVEIEGDPVYLGGGTYRAVGRGGSITGSGAHCLIMDDLIKDAQEADSHIVHQSIWDWYSSTARTRLSPGGGVLLVMTRWNVSDLVGRLLDEEKKNPEADKWDLVNYQAIAEQNEKYRKEGESLLPSRWSAEDFLKIKANTAPRWWDALYQQNPIIKGGNLFKEAYFRRYQSPPKDFDHLIIVWDLRFGKSQKKSSSFVCGWVIGMKGGQFFILDERRDRWSYAESREQVKAMAADWPTAMAKVVENKANGPALESDLEEHVSGIVLYDPRGDKYQRAERVLPLCMAGNVFLPADDVAPWVKEAITELTSFPSGANDDRVDCLSMGLSYLIENATGSYEVKTLDGE
jgi:predicted phage terminase large subunit-like protein